MPLTDKQQRFVEEYLIDSNATQAAIRAGYSERTAGSQGFDLLKKPEIAAAIDAGRAKLTASATISAKRVLEEIGRLATGDLRDLHTADGSPIPIQDWPPHIAACVSSIEYETITVGEGETKETRQVISKVRLWSKPEALRLAAQYHKLLTDKVQLEAGESLIDLLAAVEARHKQGSP